MQEISSEKPLLAIYEYDHDLITNIINSIRLKIILEVPFEYGIKKT